MLEFLELGIHGKWALWRALGTVAETDPQLKGKRQRKYTVDECRDLRVTLDTMNHELETARMATDAGEPRPRE
jgi:hypothetical protein